VDIKISTSRISTGSIFKLMLIGLTMSLVPIGLVFGVLGALDAGAVNWNGKNLHGVSALLASPLIGLLASLLDTVITGSLVAFGLWLYSKFKPIAIWIEE